MAFVHILLFKTAPSIFVTGAISSLWTILRCRYLNMIRGDMIKLEIKSRIMFNKINKQELSFLVLPVLWHNCIIICNGSTCTSRSLNYKILRSVSWIYMGCFEQPLQYLFLAHFTITVLHQNITRWQSCDVFAKNMPTTTSHAN